MISVKPRIPFVNVDNPNDDSYNDVVQRAKGEYPFRLDIKNIDIFQCGQMDNRQTIIAGRIHLSDQSSMVL